MGYPGSKTRRGRVGKDVAQTLETQICQGIAIPVLTPDRVNKSQNGRRLKEDGDPSFTLTTKDIQGVAVVGGFGEKKSNSGTQWYQQDRVSHTHGLATSLNSQLPGGGQMYAIPTTVEMGGNVCQEGGETAHRLNANDQRKVFGANQKRTLGGQVYDTEPSEIDTIYYPKRDCYIAIRRLTPKECFRLQGFSDELFEKAQFVNSDSQLYKQSGNAVTVPVVKAVGTAILNAEDYEDR